MNDLHNSDTPQRVRIDTNIIIRCLVGDGGDHAQRAKQIFKRAENGKLKLLLCDTVFIEVVFVLERVYKYKRADIVRALKTLLRFNGIETDSPFEILDQALEFYERINAPWPDCVIAAKCFIENTPVYSFDGHFSKFPGIVHLEP